MSSAIYSSIDGHDEGACGASRVSSEAWTSVRVQLYSEAVTLGNRGQWAAAEPLVRQAIAEDPGFASAHQWLGYALENQGVGRATTFPHFERAAQLADTTSDRERYFIMGPLLQWVGRR